MIILALVVLTLIAAVVLNIVEERRDETRYAAKLALYSDKAERRSYYPKGIVVQVK